MTHPIPDDEEHVLEANVVFHTALAETYDALQPHFRPENVQRVSALLQGFSEQTTGRALLDLGCGTGFVINLARHHFAFVLGVDITDAMLARVGRRSGEVAVVKANTTRVPVASNQFDVCTAYSYLHHLYDLKPTLAEAYRCLRPGGVFYADQDPNRLFWAMSTSLQGRSDLDGFVKREVHAVTETAEDGAAETALTPEQVAMAEYQKVMKGGLDPDAVTTLLTEVGFKQASCRYEWFLGQGKVLHAQSAHECQVVETFLREALPATRQLFKYVSFTAVK